MGFFAELHDRLLAAVSQSGSPGEGDRSHADCDDPGGEDICETSEGGPLSVSTRQMVAVATIVVAALVGLSVHGVGHKGGRTLLASDNTTKQLPTAGVKEKAHTSHSLVMPSPTALPSEQHSIVVSVVGAVDHPGLVTLSPGARAADALAVAHPKPGAQTVVINLAEKLVDGRQITVPGPGETEAGAGAAGTQASATTHPAGPVSLSSATREELTTLPGIGPATAQKIIDYRQTHGSFASVNQLSAVKGIGPAKVNALMGLVVP